MDTPNYVTLEHPTDEQFSRPVTFAVPSVYGQMGRCASPCLGDLDPNAYRRQVDLALTQSGKIAEGELVIIVAGSPPGVAGHTNMIRVRRIGARL